MISRSSRLFFVLLSLFALTAAGAGRRVVFVDNGRTEQGNGNYDKPYNRLAIAERYSSFDDVIYVAEGSGPYDESITLKRGQILVGSAYGLEALRADDKLELDAPVVAAMQGPGPIIRGGVTLTGTNLVAGVTVVTMGAAAIAASATSGPLTIRNTYVRTTAHANGIVLSAVDYPVTVSGGSLDATAEGNGIAIWGGSGDVTFDGFNVAGNFGNAVDIRGRVRGAVVFRGRFAIKIADATQPAVTIAGNTGRVEFAVPLQITARAPGLTIAQSSVKVGAGWSWISTAEATALSIVDSTVDAGFVSVSAAGTQAKLAEGIVLDKVRGRLVIAGEEEKPGTGGTIRNARLHGIRVTQSSGVRIANMTLVDDGTPERVKCDEAVESKTNLQCRAALYLRHLSRSEFSNITVNGGRQIGLNGNNLQDVTFGGLEIHGIGDAPSDAAVLLDEINGTVRFNRCTFDDAAGGAVVIAQQFNAGKVIFDRSTLGAPGRPVAAPQLVLLRSHGSARLEVELRNSNIHDNAGGAVRGEAAGSSALRLTLVDTHVERLGGTSIDLAAREGAQIALAFERADVMTPAVVDRPAVTIAANDASSACFSVAQSRVYTAAAGAPVRITAAPSARVSIVRGNGEPPGIEAPASATAVSACP
jgi:hypothetical protein